MSLRPAQELVEESSRFSLRTFFESSASPPPPPLSQSQSPQLSHFTVPSEATGTVYTVPKSTIPINVEHALRHQPPSPYNNIITASTPVSKEQKFTFNGLVATTTPIQKQHQFLEKHQQTNIKSRIPTEQGNDSNEVALLKAQVLSLTEQTNSLNANLDSTSESVIIGNKALRTERAQFHAKFAHITRKLQAAQAEIATGADIGHKTISDMEILNVEIKNLQTQILKLTATNAELISDINDASVALNLEKCKHTDIGAECPPVNEQSQELLDQEAKYATLAAQHSLALQRQEQIGHELEEHKVLLSTASAEVDTVNAMLDSNKLLMATTDQLVDELDERLALARMEPREPIEVPIAAVAVACPKIQRSEELKKCAEEARSAMHLATDENCERLGEEFRFAEAMAKRAVWSVEQNLPERVTVAHVYSDNASIDDDDCCCMNEYIQRTPLMLGKPFDEQINLARVNVHGTAVIMTPNDGKIITDRTNAYVQSISKDLKFHMDDSQALYKSSSSTGSALKI